MTIFAQHSRRHRLGTAAIVLGVFMASASCSLDPGPVPDDSPTHPAGTVITSVAVTGGPYGVAVSKGGVVYVTQHRVETIARLNLATGVVEGTVTAGVEPTDVEFNESGNTAYVTNQFSHGLGVVTVASGVQGTLIPVGGDPFRVAVQPGNGRIYVSSNSDSVYAIDPATNTIIARIEVGLDPNGLGFNADGSRLWVTNLTSGTVSEVNTGTNTVTRTFTVAGTPQDIVVSPDGAELYIANLANGVQVWNPGTQQLITTIQLQDGGFGLAMSPDGAQLYAAATLSGKVYIIDRATRAITRTLDVGGAPRRVAFSLKGDVAVISNEDGSVTFVR